MKKLLLIVMLFAFSYTAFAANLPQQDTTRSRQDTTKKHSSKKSPMKKKPMKKKDWSKKDTLNNGGRRDTTVRPQ